MTFQPEFIAALAIGFFGSLHCLGMCGPIALATPSIFPGTWGRILSGLIYNGGRIVTYSLLGLLAGMIGLGFSLFKAQQWVSIVLGSIMLLYVIAPSVFSGKLFGSAGNRVSNALKTSLSTFLRKTSPGGVFAIGLANGLLPCGLVYMALAGSLESSSAINGALFIVFFGLGTVPMMSGVHLMGNNMKGSFKNKLSRLLPAFVFIMGVLFILRGLGLGIPYVSPSIEPHTGDIHCVSPAHRHMK